MFNTISQTSWIILKLALVFAVLQSWKEILSWVFKPATKDLSIPPGNKMPSLTTNLDIWPECPFNTLEVVLATPPQGSLGWNHILLYKETCILLPFTYYAAQVNLHILAGSCRLAASAFLDDSIFYPLWVRVWDISEPGAHLVNNTNAESFQLIQVVYSIQLLHCLDSALYLLHHNQEQACH